MRITLEQSFATAVRPSQRVLRTACMFGLGVDEAHRLTVVPRTELDLPIPGKAIIFITGPSGGGKSTLLRLLAEHVTARGVRAIDLNNLPPLPDAPLVDAFDEPLERVTSLLAAAGLGDAFLILRRPCELSDGQRARLRLAHAMLLASRNPPALLLADEFTATLDRVTAKIIARNIRRWIDRYEKPITFIAATTHDDLLEPLAPDVLINKGLGDEMEVVRCRDRNTNALPHGRSSEFENLHIETGSPRDYKALSRFHYRSPRLGVVTTTYRLVHESPTVIGRHLQRKGESQIVGVLLRALPHLACSLRDLATNGRYRGLSPRASALVLNREVRSIARVVIHPQWRGLGLAADLVRHALAHPEPGQVYTEALAAMGHVHPFFERAGMTRYDRPPRKEHARLLDALARLEIEPFMLASPRAFLRLLREREENTQVWFEHELARWCAGGARRTRKYRRRSCRGGETASGEANVETMLAIARDQLLVLPVYYLFRHA